MKITNNQDDIICSIIKCFNLFDDKSIGLLSGKAGFSLLQFHFAICKRNNLLKELGKKTVDEV